MAAQGYCCCGPIEKLCLKPVGVNNMLVKRHLFTETSYFLLWQHIH